LLKTRQKISKSKNTLRIYDRLVAEKYFTGDGVKAKQSKVFIPLSYEPGEAIQVDWWEATVYLASKKIKVNLWCMRECYGADIFCNRQNEESFLEGQISGLDYFGGVPKRD